MRSVNPTGAPRQAFSTSIWVFRHGTADWGQILRRQFSECEIRAPPRAGKRNYRNAGALKLNSSVASLLVTLHKQARKSEGIFSNASPEHGQPHYLNVEPEIPMLNVVKVVLDSLLHLLGSIGLASPPIHLCPTGNAGFYFVT